MSGATPIVNPISVRIKRREPGGAAGAPGNLADGELAYNASDPNGGKLYYGYGVAPDGVTAQQAVAVGGPGLFAAYGLLSQPTGQQYADRGALIARVADRLLAGAAADNPGLSNRAATPTDWLSALMATTSIGAWPVYGAQSASLARHGSIGLLGASRASDAVLSSTLLGYQPAAIGVAAWGINDTLQNPTAANAWAFYGEAWRMAGVNYQPTFAAELEAVNFGTDVNGSHPFASNVGGGTYCMQLGSGGGQTAGTTNAEAAFVLVRNPSRFHSGFIFSHDSLVGTDGTNADTGYGRAIALARNQAIEWIGQDGQTRGFMRATGTNTANATRIEFQDTGVVISNAAGQVLLTIQTQASPNNTLSIQAGAGMQAAGLYAQAGTSGNGNIGLYPASGGELQISSPVTAQGASLPTTPVGWLHMNINGTDYRLPLFTAAQAGG